MNKVTLKKVFTVAIQSIIIFLIFVVEIVAVRARPQTRTFVNEYAHFNIEYADGTSKVSDDQNFGTVNKGDTVTVHLNLPSEPIVDDAVLTFFIYHSVTEIYCDGILIDSYGAAIDAKHNMVSSHYFLVPVPDNAWGGEITIIMHVTENAAFNRVKNMGLYTAQDAYQYFIDMDFTSFIISPSMFLGGLMALITFLIGGQFTQAKRKDIYLSLFAILAATWLITKTGIQNLAGMHGYLWTQMEFVAAFTMAIPVLLWAYETEDKGRLMRKVLLIAALVNILYFAVSTVLHVSNIMHYSSTLFISNVLTLISGIILMVFATRRWLLGTKSDSLFFAGMIIMFCTGVFDLLRMNLYKYLPMLFKKSLPSVLAMGMLFFVVYLLRSYLEESKENQHEFIRLQVEAEEQSKTLATIPTGICQIVPNDNMSIVSANDIFYNIIGYSSESLKENKPKDFFTYLLDDEKTIIRQKVDEVLHGTENTGEFEISTVDMEKKPLTVMIRYYYDRAGSGNITANVIDITDRKRMEEEIRRSEARYKLALQQSGKVFFHFDVTRHTMLLSDELAHAIGLPKEVDNMPDNIIEQGLIEPQSVENYRRFYERIYAGETYGDTIISCHTKNAPDMIQWYKIAFTSVFNSEGQPISAVITYEDIGAQRTREIRNAWRELDIVSIPKEKYAIDEYDMTLDRLISQTGELFPCLPEGTHRYNEVNSFALANFVHPDDLETCNRFSDRQRLLDMFESGKTEDRCEYRSRLKDNEYHWIMLYIQMITDPYSKDVMAQLLFRDIDEEKTGIVRMRQDMLAMQHELEQSRIRVMINQMQPHFLYNALSAIQTIVKEDPNYASQLIYDFTVHLRSSIKALSSDEPIPFTDELKNIKAYLSIEQMRFGDRLKVHYEIDCDNFSVIPLSIQPLAENAARHGVYPKGEEGGNITIRTYETVSAYIVEVEDDGVGFDPSKVVQKENGSIGLKNLVYRLKTLMNADVSINSKIGQGTIVTVTIPKKKEA